MGLFNLDAQELGMFVLVYWPGLSHSMRMAATPHREARTVKLEMEDKMVQIKKFCFQGYKTVSLLCPRSLYVDFLRKLLRLNSTVVMSFCLQM